MLKYLIPSLENKGGFPSGSDGKELVCNAGDLGLIPALGRFPWRRERLPTPVSLPGESHGQRSLAGHSPRGRKESDTTERLTLFTSFSLWTMDLWVKMDSSHSARGRFWRPPAMLGTTLSTVVLWGGPESLRGIGKQGRVDKLGLQPFQQVVRLHWFIPTQLSALVLTLGPLRTRPQPERTLGTSKPLELILDLSFNHLPSLTTDKPLLGF